MPWSHALTSVEMEFGGILARVALGTGEPNDQAVVERFAVFWIDDFAVEAFARFHAFRIQTHHTLEDRTAARPRYPNDSNRTSTMSYYCRFYVI